MMKREKILDMLKDLVNEIDYDIYKEMFHYDQDDEDVQHRQDVLVKIVEKHLGEGKI